jgi:hypothetical protein
MKRLAFGLVAALLALGVTAAPAHATSWGCGRPCKHAGR